MQSAEHQCTGARLTVAFLGSGSAGNSTAVSTGDTTVLVDAGFSAREIVRRLDASGMATAQIEGIVVTHEHTDHLRGVRVLAKRLGAPVYASPGTIQAAGLEKAVDDVRPMRPGDSIRIGELEVSAFSTSHDAAEPIGIRADCGHASFGLVSDTGVMTGAASEAIAGCSIIALEFNHDIDMLAAGPYPWFLKQRILSSRGHLSNDDAARALRDLAHDGLLHVAALHRSRTNNSADHVDNALAEACAQLDIAPTVRCAHQDVSCIVVA